ncbi:unnamed protein product [Linum tenue]|uniref:Ubiquitinyl hydrolase 1 n=1 Tax=Linum tenue TaxID=586396 RepID=A0AAV0MLJ2_9ROSI|nr:unnamed protein product [Linum tenue]
MLGSSTSPARRFQRFLGFHFQIGGAESRNSAIDSLLRLLGEDDKDDVRFEGGRIWTTEERDCGGGRIERQATGKENRSPLLLSTPPWGSTDPVSLADAGEEVACVFDEIHFALIYDVLMVDG